jgi:DnaJ-class molecular chaperone
MTNTCKVCKGQGQIDDYRNNVIRCPMCAWPLAKCHGDGCDGTDDCRAPTALVKVCTAELVAVITGEQRAEAAQG